MATSVDSPSPSHILNKNRTSSSVSSPLFSPGSDKRFWSSLRNRIGTLLENRQCRVSVGQDQLNLDPSSAASYENVGESDRAKRMKEDSMLLIRGFDSISQTLSQLSNNIDNALQGARNLAEPPTLTEIFKTNLINQEELKRQETEKQEGEGDDNEKLKRQEAEKQEGEGDDDEKNKGLKRKFDQTGSSAHQESDQIKETEQIPTDNKLKKAKNIAAAMATKAASLARELKSIRSDLCFMRERCSLLEEENRRLRDGDGFSEGSRPEEDDLMRLQMEALLAEKSRLANENANLMRENQCLHQLVEYHQLTTHDLSASYEQLIQGICLDFSSPLTSPKDDLGDKEDLQTPGTHAFGFASSLDEYFQKEQQQ